MTNEYAQARKRAEATFDRIHRQYAIRKHLRAAIFVLLGLIITFGAFLLVR